MALLAIVPVLGAFIIWLPAAIFLVATGQWGKAAILAAWGGIVVALIDNLLYPILVGKRLRLHCAGLCDRWRARGLWRGGLDPRPRYPRAHRRHLEIWRRRTAHGRPPKQSRIAAKNSASPSTGGSDELLEDERSPGPHGALGKLSAAAHRVNMATFTWARGGRHQILERTPNIASKALSKHRTPSLGHRKDVTIKGPDASIHRRNRSLISRPRRRCARSSRHAGRKDIP